MNSTEQRYWTMDEIRSANRATGGHWFDADTMRFFRSRVGDAVYQGPGGVYFVSSEQFVPSTGRPAERRYTVRKFNPETGDVDTAGDFNKLSRSVAVAAARRLAQGS